jgi:nucleotide-binding universal stress UspA family protein
MIRNILVALDGSEHALKAAGIAKEMAICLQADLWVVVAYDPLPSYLGDPVLQEAITTRLSQSEEILQSGLQEIGQIPGAVKTEILEGPPAEAILSVAETRGVDLIIMGTRGLGMLAGLLVGSQSQKVVAHAHCPVLLVR